MKKVNTWLLALSFGTLAIFASCGGDEAGTSLKMTLNGKPFP